MSEINLNEILGIFGIQHKDYIRRKRQAMEYKSLIAYVLTCRFGYKCAYVAPIMELDRTTVLHHRNKVMGMLMMYSKFGSFAEEVYRIEGVEKLLREYIDFKKELELKTV